MALVAITTDLFRYQIPDDRQFSKQKQTNQMEKSIEMEKTPSSLFSYSLLLLLLLENRQFLPLSCQFGWIFDLQVQHLQY